MKSKKAFTLVEVLVVMGIIAVLMGLAVFGISILNRNSRDSQRVSTLAEMVRLLNDYKKDNLNYPITSLVGFNSTAFRINSVDVLPLKDSNKYGSSTSSSQTRYQYVNNNGKFGLCAILESGEVKNVGDLTLTCL